MKETLRERDVSEGGQLTPGYRQKVNDSLAASKRVAEFLARGQGRGAGGQNLEFWEKVGADFQDPTGIMQLLIHNDLSNM